MLAKKNRASTKIVEKVFKTGKFINSQFLSFKYMLNKGVSDRKISFLAPKNIAKIAVKRNALRRLGYRVLKQYVNEFPAGIEGVLVYKKPLNTAVEVENEIKNILNKIN